MKLTYFDFGLGVTGMVPTSEAVHIYVIKRGNVTKVTTT